MGKSWELLRSKWTSVKTVARYRKLCFFVLPFFFFSNITWKFRLCSSGHVLARRVMARCGHSFCLWVNTLLLSGDPKFIEMFASFQLSFWSEICPGPQQFRAIFQKNKNFKKVCFVTSNSLDDENPESKSETEAITGSPLGEGIARYYHKSQNIPQASFKRRITWKKILYFLVNVQQKYVPSGWARWLGGLF